MSHNLEGWNNFLFRNAVSFIEIEEKYSYSVGILGENLQ
jgi:hypothetical protein